MSLATLRRSPRAYNLWSINTDRQKRGLRPLTEHEAKSYAAMGNQHDTPTDILLRVK